MAAVKPKGWSRAANSAKTEIAQRSRELKSGEARISAIRKSDIYFSVGIREERMNQETGAAADWKVATTAMVWRPADSRVPQQAGKSAALLQCKNGRARS